MTLKNSTHHDLFLSQSKESEVDDSDVNVQLGSFVALGLDEFKEELPQIAKVLAIDDDSITLEWWVGTYTGTWVPWLVKSVEQTISVHRNNIVLRNISLSKSNRLYEPIIDKLKSIYDNFEFM